MKKYNVIINGKNFDVDVLRIDSKKAKLLVNGIEIEADILTDNRERKVSNELIDNEIVDEKLNQDSFTPVSHPDSTDVEGIVRSMMPGKIISVEVKQGDNVKQGELVCVMESMKMEQNILAAVGGKILEVNIKSGDTVEHGAILIRIG